MSASSTWRVHRATSSEPSSSMPDPSSTASISRGSPEFERWVERQRVEYAARAAGALEIAGQAGGPAGRSRSGGRLVAPPECIRPAQHQVRAGVGGRRGSRRQPWRRDSPRPGARGIGPGGAWSGPRSRAGGPGGRIRDGATLGGRISQSSLPVPARSAPAARGPVRAQREGFRELLQRELGDRYELEQEAETGGGGHTRVLPARDRRHDRPVTLKVLHPGLASRIDVERFVREIRFTGKLVHPHILPLLDSGEVAGRPWFAVPRPKGETLRSRLSREGRVPADEAVRLTRELADALGQAHAEGIVHRDVSPENVLLAASPPRDGGTVPGCHALLTNLGLARALDVAAGAGADGDRHAGRYAGVHEPGAGAGRPADRRRGATPTRSRRSCSRC